MTCTDCNCELNIRVCQSAAGFYLGRWCNCGPYSRESGYYATREEAQSVLGDVSDIDDFEDSGYPDDEPVGPDNYSDDGDALASAGMGTDEDYGCFGGDDY